MHAKMIGLAALATGALLLSGAHAQTSASGPALSKAQSSNTGTAAAGDPSGAGPRGGSGSFGRGPSPGGSFGGTASHGPGYAPPPPPLVGSVHSGAPTFHRPGLTPPAAGRFGPPAGAHVTAPRIMPAFRFQHRDFAHFTSIERAAWRGGHWTHGWHHRRFGWWWFAGGVWFFYDTPIYPYPEVVSTVYVDESSADYGQYWYYCNDPQGYYPYVRACNVPWEPVPAMPPDTSSPDNQ